MDKSRRYSPARKSFPSLLFRHNRRISEEMPTSFSFKHGNIDIRGGFRVSSARAPHRSPTSGPGQADRNTRGDPEYTVTSGHRSKLGRNLSAGVLRQDVVNAATLTHTKDDY